MEQEKSRAKKKKKKMGVRWWAHTYYEKTNKQITVVELYYKKTNDKGKKDSTAQEGKFFMIKVSFAKIMYQA